MLRFAPEYVMVELCHGCQNRAKNPVCSVEEAISKVQNARSLSSYRAGQTIFYEGSQPLGLYVIRKGLVKLESLSSEGESHILRLMGPGQVLGYRALFAEEAYRANAIAVEDVEICFIPKNVLLNEIVKEHPEVAMNLLRQLSRDLQLAEEKWVLQVDRDAGERVAEAILFLNQHFQGQPWTRRQIAEWAGTTPETVMRTLAQFEKNGWVEAQGRLYKILDQEKLFEKSQGA